jgi:hypothetical protein
MGDCINSSSDKAIFIGTIFLWNVFLFWVIWFTYSSDKMSTLDTMLKIMTRTSCWGTVKGKLLNSYIKNCHMIVRYMITITQNRKTFHKNIVPINIAFLKWYFASNKIIFHVKTRYMQKRRNDKNIVLRDCQRQAFE